MSGTGKRRGVKRKTPPRNRWTTGDVIRIAILAGQGASAGQIAKIIGGTTPDRVRSVCREYGIPLLRTNSGEDFLMIRWKTGDRALLNAEADRLDREPGELAALIVRRVLADRSAEKLVDKFDVVGI